MMFFTFAFALKTSWSIRKDNLSKLTYVSFKIPVSLMILVSITIFSTDFGKSGYLKEALLEAISKLNFGIVVSVSIPFAKPETVKSPVVFTLAKFPAYASGITPKKFLNEEVGVLKVKS